MPAYDVHDINVLASRVTLAGSDSGYFLGLAFVDPQGDIEQRLADLARLAAPNTGSL